MIFILMQSGYDQCRQSYGTCQEVGIQAVGNSLCYLEKEKKNKRTAKQYLQNPFFCDFISTIKAYIKHTYMCVCVYMCACILFCKTILILSIILISSSLEAITKLEVKIMPLIQNFKGRKFTIMSLLAF